MKSPALIGRLGLYGFLIATALFFAIPLVIVFLTSLKDLDEARAGSIFVLPQTPDFEAHVEAWTSACIGRDCTGIGGRFWNSVVITVLATSVSLLIASINGFALAMWNLRGAGIVLALLLVGAFVPYQIVIYPLVRMFAVGGIHQTLTALVIVHVLFGLPILTLIFRNVYLGLPAELVKAARVDGASFFQIYFLVILPMSLNVIIVAGIISVTGVWNDYLLGLIFAGADWQPMTVSVASLTSTSATGVPAHHVNMAATLLTALPPLLLYLFSGKYFVRGVTAGAVKG
ncbi:carbohydrate ABC transporter permease [Roseisalinus antarcticus]|uniref:L-arabinose transport system permease protein AraQ n=1 Tax=Roseisalinus antarcticus TaxID=254357 RepID=A0A1Y5TDJ5_9RHOB|nr:carbohydrate ABC transporter permease [Roseisalinus antarcticus]SLN61560.1 L-arabinose transport system permease protein AraQ [Roseisalinus antarcticus]